MSKVVPSRAVHQRDFAFLLEPDEVLPVAVALDEPATLEDACESFCEAMDGLTDELRKFNTPEMQRGVRKLFSKLLVPKRAKQRS